MDLYPIQSEEELANELFNLVERAKMGGLNNSNIQSLDAIISEINQSSPQINPSKQRQAEENTTQAGSAEMRDSYRMSVNQEAVTIFHSQRHHMNIVDVSTSGFGLRSEESAPHGEEIYLEINGLDGMDIFHCIVCFCGTKDGIYHVGLRILKKLPRL